MGMRSWANALQEYYGQLVITPASNGGFALIVNSVGLSAEAIQGGVGIAALTEWAGNGNTAGTNSLSIGQTAAGVATILARGVQALNIGINGGGQLQIDSSGNVYVPTTTGGASPAAIYAGAPVTSFGTSNPTMALLNANWTWRSSASGLTITIPANSSIAYPIGTMQTFINRGGGTMSIAITTDTMTLANSATTGTRSLAANGVATAIKDTATTWIISGAGLT